MADLRLTVKERGLTEEMVKLLSAFLSPSPRTLSCLHFHHGSVVTKAAVEQLGHTRGSSGGKQDNGCKGRSHLWVS